MFSGCRILMQLRLIVRQEPENDTGPETSPGKSEEDRERSSYRTSVIRPSSAALAQLQLPAPQPLRLSSRNRRTRVAAALVREERAFYSPVATASRTGPSSS